MKITDTVKFSLCVIAVLATCSFSYIFASEDPSVLFREAISLEESALKPDPGSSSENSQVSNDCAKNLFSKSALLYESAAANDWKFWYEAGNARWWASDPSRAIVDYRRYLANDAFRIEVWENLSEARKAAGTLNPGHEGLGEWPWHLWLASAAACIAGLACLSFGLFLFFRKRPWRNATFTLCSIAVFLALGSVICLGLRKPLAVIVTETQGRKGDSSVYAAFPTSPWKSGQEVWITEVRDTWTRILVGGTVSWVPSQSIIRIERAR
jgi:hypothetical protein